RLLVKRRDKAIQTRGSKGLRELFILECGVLRWVGQRCAQRSQRGVGLARHEHDAIRQRHCDATRAPGPQAADRPEQDRLARPRLTHNKHTVALRDLYMLLAQRGAARRRGNLQVLEGEVTVGRLYELDTVLGRSQAIHCYHGLAEARYT